MDLQTLLMLIVSAVGVLGQNDTSDPTGDPPVIPPAEPSTLWSNELSFAVVFGTWGLVGVIFLVAWCLGRMAKPKVLTVYDSCNPSDATHFYMMRVKVGRLSPEMLKGRHHLMVDLHSVASWMARFRIPIREFLEHESKKDADAESRIIKFQVGRSKPLGRIAIMRFETNSHKEKVFIYFATLREMDSDKGYRTPVNDYITHIHAAPDPNQKDKQFFATEEEKGGVGADWDDSGSNDLTPIEVVLFIFFAANLIIITSLYLPQHASSLDSYKGSAFNGLTAGAVAIGATLLLVLLYRFLKAKTKKPGKVWPAMKILFIVIVIAGAVGMGVVAAIYGTKLSNDQLIYWTVAIAIGGALFLIIGIPLIYLINFLFRRDRRSDPEDAEGKETRPPPPDNRVKKTDSDGANYFNAIMKDSNVHSISQYNKKKKASVPQNVTPPPPAQPVKKVESHGSEYFKQIQDKNRVTSISQYMKKKPNN